ASTVPMARISTGTSFFPAIATVTGTSPPPFCPRPPASESREQEPQIAASRSAAGRRRESDFILNVPCGPHWSYGIERPRRIDAEIVRVVAEILDRRRKVRWPVAPVAEKPADKRSAPSWTTIIDRYPIP